MTQKELLYLEDAVCHEKIIVSNLIDIMNCLNEECLKDFIKKEIDKHQRQEKNLMTLLKENVNE